jgi:hypothetical protein
MVLIVTEHIIMAKLEIFIPQEYLEKLREALRSVGAGAFGNYDSVLSYSTVKGCWRPLTGANPYDGELGVLCERDEYKIEVICRAEDIKKTIAAIKKIHPYEEPVINIIPLWNNEIGNLL